MTASIPAAVREFASQQAHPVALIGCHVSEKALDCCEYDLAVFSTGENRVLHLDGLPIEVLHFKEPNKNYITDLYGMEVLKDTNKFMLASALHEIKAEKYTKAMVAAGKKSLLSSLFCQRRMALTKQPIASAMWLKIAAYDLVEGLLAISGTRPMPLHELGQLRQAKSEVIVEGTEVALECIGIERATRSAISRTIHATKELKSTDYDRELSLSKADYLLDRSMLSDCYYYAGRMAAKSLTKKSESFHVRYAKLIQLALDLSSDVRHQEKMQKKLFKAARSSLKA